VSGAGAPGFLDALAALRDGLVELDLPWMVIDGVAVIASGVPRFTADIDVTLSASSERVERIIEVLGSHGITPRIADAVAFARDRHVLLMRHEASGVPLDISMARLPFEEDAIRASETTDYAGVSIRVPRVDDLIVYKLVASRARDLDEVEHLLALSGRRVDVARLRSLVSEFAAALDDVERPATLERLLRQAGLA
jgi:hypothetical protein